MRALTTAWDAGRSMLHGDIDQTEEKITAAYELGQQIGQPDAVIWGAAQVCLLRLDQDRGAEIVDAVLGFADVYPHIRGWLAAGALCLAQQGRVDEAKAIIDELAPDNFRSMPNDYIWLCGIRCTVEAMFLCGDAEQAEVLHRLVVPYEGQLAHIYIWGQSAVARTLGQLEVLLGRYDEAERHFEAGVEMHERIGQDHYAAYTRLDWAQMLLARGAEGDRARALDLVDQAAEVARRRGYPLAERRAAEILTAAG
jgi:tetratricopeptide (TPR) repeat protein